MTATLHHLIMVVNLCLQLYMADMDKTECEIEMDILIKECNQEIMECEFDYMIEINGIPYSLLKDKVEKEETEYVL